MSAKTDEAVESTQEEMICSNCSEKIIGKAMKVVSSINTLLHISSQLCFRLEAGGTGMRLASCVQTVESNS